MSEITIERSFDLHMSYTVNAATLQAVRASISTPVRSTVSTCDSITILVSRNLEVDSDRANKQRMAQGDQVGTTLCGLDPGNASDRQYVSLLYCSLSYSPARFQPSSTHGLEQSPGDDSDPWA